MPLPRAFETVEELIERCDAYFEECEAEKKVAHWVGLSVACGVCRDTLHAYSAGENDDDERNYSATLKKYKAKCELSKLDMAYAGNADKVITIFDLKNNHGWKDQRQTDLTSGGNPINFGGNEKGF